MNKQSAGLLYLAEMIPDEQAAIDYFTAIRWKSGSFCPHCAGTKIYTFSDRRTHKCAECRKRFSIKVGTIFEDTKIPLRKWFMAMWFMSLRTKGIASTQLASDIGVTQKTAWLMMHRLRHAAITKSFNAPLQHWVSQKRPGPSMHDTPWLFDRGEESPAGKGTLSLVAPTIGDV